MLNREHKHKCKCKHSWHALGLRLKLELKLRLMLTLTKLQPSIRLMLMLRQAPRAPRRQRELTVSFGSNAIALIKIRTRITTWTWIPKSANATSVIEPRLAAIHAGIGRKSATRVNRLARTASVVASYVKATGLNRQAASSLPTLTQGLQSHCSQSQLTLPYTVPLATTQVLQRSQDARIPIGVVCQQSRIRHIRPPLTHDTQTATATVGPSLRHGLPRNWHIYHHDSRRRSFRPCHNFTPTARVTIRCHPSTIGLVNL